MANVNTNLLKLKEVNNDKFDKLVKEISKNPGVIHCEKIGENRLDFMSRVEVYSFLSELSSDLELAFECINYDTSMGYANKSIFDDFNMSAQAPGLRHGDSAPFLFRQRNKKSVKSKYC